MLDRVVGNYRLVRKIGEGGMGEVYEAHHVRIGKRAAVKVLHPDLARRKEFADRFFNEASAISVVRHPGILNIFEFGSADDGTLFLIMEFLEGETLGDRIRRLGPGVGDEAMRLSRQIASTLAAAHDKGIVHRDLKPDNVMIVADPEAPGGERAKILDFGIAKLVEDYEGPRAHRSATETGATVGTPVYMSPEQCRSSARVGPRSDVYALGVMLYEMLAGRPPFIGEGSGHVIAMHIYEAPAPLQSLAPSVPAPLAQLVDQMLAKEPSARPTMHDVAQALEGLGAPRSTTLALVPPSARGPASRSDLLQSTLGGASAERLTEAPPPSRLPLALGGGALALLAGALVLVLIRKPIGEPPPPPPLVSWSIESDPSGAEIVRLTDKHVVGRTPLSEKHQAVDGSLPVLLRMKGYEDLELSLDLSTNTLVSKRLRPRPADPPKDSGKGQTKDSGKGFARDSAKDPAKDSDEGGGASVATQSEKSGRPSIRGGSRGARKAAPARDGDAPPTPGPAPAPEMVEDLGKLKAPRRAP